MDEPKGGLRTGGWVAAPAVGRTIDRIAPFLGVSRNMTPAYGAPTLVAARATVVPAAPESGL